MLLCMRTTLEISDEIIITPHPAFSRKGRRNKWSENSREGLSRQTEGAQGLPASLETGTGQDLARSPTSYDRDTLFDIMDGRS